MKTVIIGTGLIGGSLARDLRSSGIATRITGVEQSAGHAARAIEIGIVDDIRPLSDAVAVADLVVMTIPVDTIARVLPQVLDHLPEHGVVIDAGSTKQQVCRAVAGHAKRSRFVAAHPIAGTENSGPDAAMEGLFRGKTNIICERELSDPDAVELAIRVFDTLGMKSVFMEAEEHDKHVAYVSHLSHVSSFLLGHTVLDIEKDEKNIFDLAGSGFASTVRLAKSSPEMWAPIFEQNAEYLSQALLEYIMHLQRFHYHLMKRDGAELRRIMSGANQIRRVLEGLDSGNKLSKDKNQ